MGKKGREIVELAVPELIEDLNRAYADEWVATYYYKLAATVASGMNAPVIAGELKKIADDEEEHADELAARIIQLGGTPISDLAQIPKKANCPSVNLPKEPSDLKGIVKAIIEAERCAIGVYDKLLKKVMMGKDPVTFHLIRHILEEEVKHEDDFENLLGR